MTVRPQAIASDVIGPIRLATLSDLPFQGEVEQVACHVR